MSGWWLVSYVILWVMSAATLVVLLVVLRQLGLIYLRGGAGAPRLEEGPPLGATIAPFEVADDASGVLVSFPDRRAGLNVLLFTSPQCRICEEVLRELPEATRDLEARVLVVSEGTPEENRELRRLAGTGARFATSPTRQRILRIRTFPYAVVAGPDGTVLDKGVVNSPRDVEALLQRAVERRTTDSPALAVDAEGG